MVAWLAVGVAECVVLESVWQTGPLDQHEMMTQQKYLYKIKESNL